MSTPAINMDWLKAATLEDLKAVLRGPAVEREQANLLLRTPEGAAIAAEMINNKDYVPVSKRVPDAEEEAAIAADTTLADQQAAADAAAAAAAVPPPVVEEKKKIVIDYQVTAEDGTPIGRPTHFEGWTPEEIYAKYQAAHINAVRYAERVKKGRVQSVESQTEQKELQQNALKSKAEADAAVAEASKDTSKLPEAIRKVTKADREAQIAAETARTHGEIIAKTWMADHKEDFLPCEANSKIIGEWLKANSLEFSYDNLELAYTANETRLAKPEPPAPVVAASAALVENPPVVAPAVAAAEAPSITAPAAAAAVPASTTATSASQPASTVPAPTPVAATNTPAARRPGVNGSLPPGSLTAGRPSGAQTPVVSTAAELKREIARMPRGEFQKKLKDANYVKRLIAAGIPVVGHSA